ncbi:hypothetical protein AG1IA_03220 [Rhizoctonia solani AG-1 IA]|uniref:Uncharacterized protein n=1 Tax=Thanatephorus cucumeris (strain AG1-IA) TaxID=983506 RepID=L8WXN7_THACA|nr:hypothetical protein AG1IA_03220 [Rhizoctonia solani AG-1 IA]
MAWVQSNPQNTSSQDQNERTQDKLGNIKLSKLNMHGSKINMRGRYMSAAPVVIRIQLYGIVNKAVGATYPI